VRKSYLAVALMLLPSTAGATMPPLSDMPSRRTDDACWTWAEKQVADDEDVAAMWGLRETGDSDPKVAARRLTDYCVGKPVPKIVYFYSSAGVADAYCRSHARERICVMHRGR